MQRTLSSTKNRPLFLLAIETSCDETAIAIIKTSASGRVFHVLSHIILSQISLHAAWGGVVPNLAKREHEKALVPLLLQALKETRCSISNIKFETSNLKSEIIRLKSILEREPELLQQFIKHIIPLEKPPVDLIAVTQGPGLEPALWVGVNFARALSALWNTPLAGVNHMEGHIVSALIKQKSGKISNFQFSISKQNQNFKTKIQKPKTYNLKPITYPAISLLVSGGHTELVLIKKPLQYEIIGETRDDAAGEAFDKVARILGLGYPGGPTIAREANLETGRPSKLGRPVSKLLLPRPMINSKNFDFSFSGLKTAVLYLVRDLEKQGISIKKMRSAIANEFQNAVIDVLVAKTIRAAKTYKVKTVLLGGGVAANIKLRNCLKEKLANQMPDTKYYIPNPDLTGDNALMIAVAVAHRIAIAKKTVRAPRFTKNWKTLKPDSIMRLQ